MSGIRVTFLCALVCLAFAPAADAKKKPKPKLKGSIGFYSNGCLRQGKLLEDETIGILKVSVERKRHWGNAAMIELLNILGLSYRSVFPEPYERLQVADIGPKLGGDTNGHASHENGLDVDTSYLRVDRREGDKIDEEFVVDGEVTSNFDGLRNWWVLRWLYESGQVDRVFVDQKIKEHFCQHAQEYDEILDKQTDPAASVSGHSEDERAVIREEALRRLRPWPSHGNHFHLRLKCPKADKYCEGSEPPPEGTGCDTKALALAPNPTLDHHEVLDGLDLSDEPPSRYGFIKAVKAPHPLCK